jgi:hypothetical protein
MMRMRHPAIAALFAVGVLLLAACSTASTDPPPPAGIDLESFDTAATPGNGLWMLTGAAAADEVVAAARSAGSVHYTATFTELTLGTPETEPAPGRTLAVDFTGRPGEATARITAGDVEFEAVLVDGRTYVRGNAAYAVHTGLAEVERGFVCSIGEETFLEEWAPLLQPANLVAALLESSESLIVEQPEGDESTVSLIVGASDAPVGSMVVQRSGPPLPVTFTAGDGSGDGDFAFTAWGEPVDVSAPTDSSVDCAS